MTFEVLETERLKLRKITPEVLDFVFANYNNEALLSFLALSSNADIVKEREKHQIGLRTFNKSFLYFHLIDRVTETVIGYCGFHTWYLDHARAEIGYILYHDAYKGQGLMTEAILTIVNYGFHQMQLNRIEAFVSPTNQPSLQLLKKLQFTQEGYLRQHYFSQGIMGDSLLFCAAQGRIQPRPASIKSNPLGYNKLCD